MAIQQFQLAAKFNKLDLVHVRLGDNTGRVLKTEGRRVYVDFGFYKDWVPMADLLPGPGPGYSDTLDPYAKKAAPKKIPVNVGEFTRKMLKDLGEFQNYGGSGKFKKLGESLLSHPWPTRFTKAPSSDVYRIMCLPQKVFDEIMAGKKYKVDHASSWTLDKKVAYEFIEMHWFQDYAGDLKRKGKDPVAFIMQVKPRGKVLNIDALHKDKEFKKALDAFSDAGENFSEGMDFGDSQREVVLPTYVISKDNIIDYVTLDMKKWKSGKKF